VVVFFGLIDMNQLYDPTSEILSPSPIRVETALSRYPVHRLAKHGEIAIDIREKNETGEVSIRWEVTHSPGPLAYKLDTLIINRRIEEAARPIPRIIRLGSLRDLCRELGLNEGQATRDIRNSLYQNASAFIKCKIQYKQSNGGEKTLEAGFTRYSVVLTGEELPGGRKADAVYIVLNDIYMQVINGAMTRPLDYEYLRSLPPASQRFYELLSFQMYATIKNDRPRAKLVYSELCKYAPLVRQSDWNVVRPQLARIHAPHRRSGYVAAIEVQDTVDADGQPDWVMLYQPGPKARAEFRAFTRRGGPVLLEVEPPADANPDANPLPLPAAPEPSPLEAELIGRGITSAIAAELVRDHGEEKIRLQIEILDGLPKKKLDKIDDPAGWLVTAIKNRHAAPRGFTTRAERERQADAARRNREAEAEELRRKREQESSEQKQRQAILDYWEALTPEQQARLQVLADAQAVPEDLAKESGPLRAFGQTIRRHEYIRNLLRLRQDAPAEPEAKKQP
jgi:hypothetical protein